MARVMAKYKFDATIVFMAVAGEEQSLLGSTHYAEQAKQKNLNIDAMLTNDIIGNTLGGMVFAIEQLSEFSLKECRRMKPRPKRRHVGALVAKMILPRDN
jgi:Zn-dependent M28 family amino/carboxypeptidase